MNLKPELLKKFFNIAKYGILPHFKLNVTLWKSSSVQITPNPDRIRLGSINILQHIIISALLSHWCSETREVYF